MKNMMKMAVAIMAFTFASNAMAKIGKDADCGKRATAGLTESTAFKRTAQATPKKESKGKAGMEQPRKRG